MCTYCRKDFKSVEALNRIWGWSGEWIVLQGSLQIYSQHAMCSPLSVLTIGSLKHSPELCFNVEPLLSIRYIFKASIMTWCAHLCFLFLRGQQNNRDLSLHIRLRSPRRLAHPVMDRAPQYAPAPLPILPQSPLSRPVFCFLSMLSAVNILHQAQTIMTFIFASSFTGEACAFYT